MSINIGFQLSLRPRCGILQRIERILPAHDCGAANDKNLVSSFLRDAEEIFAAAREGGPEDCDLAILVSRDGAIHMVAGSDWGLESLRLRHGATAAYRIARNAGRVRLEARSAHESCVLRADKRGPPLTTIPDFPRYQTIHRIGELQVSVGCPISNVGRSSTGP